MEYNLNRIIDKSWLWDDTTDKDLKEYAEKILDLMSECKGIMITPDYDIEFTADKYVYGKLGEVNIRALSNMFSNTGAVTLSFPIGEFGGGFSLNLPVLFQNVRTKEDLDICLKNFETIHCMETTDNKLLTNTAYEEYWEYFSHVISTWSEYLSNKYSIERDKVADWLNANADYIRFNISYNEEDFRSYFETK